MIVSILPSLQVATVSILPHVAVEHRHLWQAMQQDTNC